MSVMPAVALKQRATEGAGFRRDLPERQVRVIYTALTDELCVNLDAIRLIELGARAGLVAQLTGLERRVVNTLFKHTLGRASPAGQLPFTDTWYLRSDRRMLHAAVVWRFYRRFAATETRRARALISCYESYCAHVSEPILCLTRAFFVPRLVSSGTWLERRCPECGVNYLKPRYEHRHLCPGCRWYGRAQYRWKQRAKRQKIVASGADRR